MEHSANSSMNKALCSNEGISSYEESGWTMYFEDFFASEKKEASGCSSSLVSDAASCAAWKASPSTEASKSCRKLSFMKRKVRGVLDDDSLEDTASSPVNSPKVGALNHLDVDPRKKEEKKHICRPEKGVSYESYAKPKHEMNELGFKEEANDCTELKKKGLCLVPLALIADFVG